ncbi:MAG TPA: thioredoxin [Candidatus Dojkabacteria bacterium]|jgi:thioredoxin 1|nr:thioredoxin [Candidatus Dojkabacteria bacterium]
MEIQVNDDNFQKEVLESEGLVLVDFWAPWCMPCRMLAPTIEEIANEMEGKVKVCKMNVDESIKYPQQYGIMSIPTVMLFKNGQTVETMIGLQPKEEILKTIQEHL